MVPLIQSRIDCFATCIESVLELPYGHLSRPCLEDLLNPERWYGYCHTVKEELAKLNLSYIGILPEDPEGNFIHPDGFAVATYPNVNTQGGHHCVVQHTGRIIHNPCSEHADESWKGELIDFIILYPLDPSKPSGRFALSGG